MASLSIETRRVDELANTVAGSGDEDLLIIRLADGTGTKSIKVKDLRSILVGDLSTLKTVDKDLVGAINELVASLEAEAKDIKGIDDRTEILKYTGAGLHNSIWRGKNLGNQFTAEQSAAIRDGSFKDIWVGDYWVINDVTWRVMDLDYWYQVGDTPCTTHHAVIVPDTPLYNAQMNTTNVTTGGYTGSAMYTSNLAQAKTMAQSAFGAGHILSHRELLTNAVSNGSSSGWAWFDSTVDLMSEHMVYGSRAWGGGAHIGYDVGAEKSQLAGFRLRHDLEHSRAGWYWLRDVCSAADFCNVARLGNASSNGASGSGGVRPAFPIY